MIQRPTGELQAFYVADSKLKMVRQTAPNSGWTSEVTLADDVGDCAGVINSTGRVDVFLVTRNAPLKHKRLRENADGSFSELVISAIPASVLTVALPHQRVDRLIELFFTTFGSQNTLQTNMLREQDSFTPPTPIASDFSPYDVGEERGGHVSMVGSGNNWHLKWLRRTVAGDAFSPPVVFSTDGMGRICMAVNADGQTEIFFIKRSDGVLQRVTQTSGSSVSAPEPFGSAEFSIPISSGGFCVIANGDKLELYVHVSNGTWTRREESVGQWSAWRSLS